jgi:hypothetical protein
MSNPKRAKQLRDMQYSQYGFAFTRNNRHLGLVRRRLGRGGRIVMEHFDHNLVDLLKPGPSETLANSSTGVNHHSLVSNEQQLFSFDAYSKFKTYYPIESFEESSLTALIESNLTEAANNSQVQHQHAVVPTNELLPLLPPPPPPPPPPTAPLSSQILKLKPLNRNNSLNVIMTDDEDEDTSSDEDSTKFSKPVYNHTLFPVYQLGQSFTNHQRSKNEDSTRRDDEQSEQMPSDNEQDENRTDEELREDETQEARGEVDTLLADLLKQEAANDDKFRQTESYIQLDLKDEGVSVNDAFTEQTRQRRDPSVMSSSDVRLALRSLLSLKPQSELPTDDSNRNSTTSTNVNQQHDYDQPEGEPTSASVESTQSDPRDEQKPSQEVNEDDCEEKMDTGSSPATPQASLDTATTPSTITEPQKPHLSSVTNKQVENEGLRQEQQSIDANQNVGLEAEAKSAEKNVIINSNNTQCLSETDSSSIPTAVATVDSTEAIHPKEAQEEKNIQLEILNNENKPNDVVVVSSTVTSNNNNNNSSQSTVLSHLNAIISAEPDISVSPLVKKPLVYQLPTVSIVNHVNSSNTNASPISTGLFYTNTSNNNNNNNMIMMMNSTSTSSLPSSSTVSSSSSSPLSSTFSSTTSLTGSTATSVVTSASSVPPAHVMATNVSGGLVNSPIIMKSQLITGLSNSSSNGNSASGNTNNNGSGGTPIVNSGASSTVQLTNGPTSLIPNNPINIINGILSKSN